MTMVPRRITATTRWLTRHWWPWVTVPSAVAAAMLLFGPTVGRDGPTSAAWCVASVVLPVAGAVLAYRMLHRRRAATPPRNAPPTSSDVHCRVRVAGLEYLILSVGYFAYAVGSFVVAGGALDRLLPAVFFTVVLVVLSVRTPWKFRVEPNRAILAVGPFGLVRIVLPQEHMIVTFHTRSDWGSKTRELRVGANQGVVGLLGPATVANARFGVRHDHSETLLAAFRRFGYPIEDEATAT